MSECGAATEHDRMATVEHLRRCPICDVRFAREADVPALIMAATAERIAERHAATMTAEQEGWAAYAAEQERHAATAARLEDMTREARLSRESTEKAAKRLGRLRDRVAYLHDVYAAAPNEPRCCSDCAANDISDELRAALKDTADPEPCGGAA